MTTLEMEALRTEWTKEEVIDRATIYFRGNTLAAESWARKYAIRREEDVFLEHTPNDMFDRMAHALSEPEKDQEKWFKIFRRQLDGFKKFVMGGSPMAGLGNPKAVSLSNCFVIPSPKDSIQDIMESAKQMAQIQAYRGGVGLDISNLRPDGALVSNAASSSTGAWSWCDLFSYVSRMIGQNGRVGALMITIRVDHPDILKFIKMKADLAKVTGANVSIKITDEFMEAVRDDDDFTLWFDFDEGSKYENIREKVKAKTIWKEIIHYATKTAEPGILMWDNIIRYSPSDCYPDEGFITISTNPCSEIPLPPWDSCRLGSINLTSHIINPFTKDASVDWNELASTVQFGVRMLDNIVDLDKLPFKEQDEIGRKGRRIGLGTHGLADSLASLNLRYDSDESIERVDKIYNFIMNRAYDYSVDLAVEKGPFPIWDSKKEKNHPFLNRLDDVVKKRMDKSGRRNIALLTCAPTGTISLVSHAGYIKSIEKDIFGVSSGVESIFSISFLRRVKLTNSENKDDADFVDDIGDAWKTHLVIHSKVLEYLDKSPDEVTEEDLKDLPDIFITSDKIDWERRIEIQSTMQRYIDHGISSTINLPKGTSEEVVAKLYDLAWQKGLKGVTIYVDGSRDGVLLTESPPEGIERRKAPKRPKELDAVAHKIGSNGDIYNVFLGFLKDNIYEVFAVKQTDIGGGIVTDGIKGKIIKRSSRCYDFDSENLLIRKINKHENTEFSSFTRILSTALRHGVPLETISEQLHKSNGVFTSMAKAMNRIISQYAEDIEMRQECPECGCPTTFLIKGCRKCKNCGYGSCGG